MRQDLGHEPVTWEYNSYYRAAHSLEVRGECRLIKESLPEVTHPEAARPDGTRQGDARPDGWLQRRFMPGPDGQPVGTKHTQPQIVVYRAGTGPAVSVETRSITEAVKPDVEDAAAEKPLRGRLAGDIARRYLGEDEDGTDGGHVAEALMQVQAMALEDPTHWAKSTAGSLGYAYVPVEDRYPEDDFPALDFDEDDNPEQTFDLCDGDYAHAAQLIADYESLYGLWRPDFDAEHAARKVVNGPFKPDPNYALDGYNDLTPEQIAALTAEVMSRRRLERF
jgi:hypothetical protein